MNWTEVAVEAGYKDSKNAKIMGGRLMKKLAGASAASASTADGENEDAGEGSSKAVATAAGKKRKATGTAKADASSPVKGEISMSTASRYIQRLTCCVAARPAKKAKVTQAEPSVEDEVAAPKDKTEDHGKSPTPTMTFISPY